MKHRAIVLLLILAVVLGIPAVGDSNLDAKEPLREGAFNALILEEEGKAGGIALGQPIFRVAGVQVGGDTAGRRIPLKGGAFVVTSSSSGNVQRIDIKAAAAAGLFTTRLVKMDDATVTDVLASYDAPQQIALSGDEMILDYGKFEFRFPFHSNKAGSARLEDLYKSLNNPLKSMALKAVDGSLGGKPVSSVQAAVSPKEK